MSQITHTTNVSTPIQTRTRVTIASLLFYCPSTGRGTVTPRNDAALVSTYAK